MKHIKTILFTMAGLWTTLLIVDKFLGAPTSIKSLGYSLPRRIVHNLFRLFKSLLVFSLIIANVFMAIALIQDKNSK